MKNFAKNLDEEEKTRLEYLDFPFLTDIETIQWLKKNRVVFVMRGLPGSGKSTLVNAISKVYDSETPVICSADHYFIDENGVYRCVIKKTKNRYSKMNFIFSKSISLIKNWFNLPSFHQRRIYWEKQYRFLLSRTFRTRYG